MARTVKDAKLDTRAARWRLKPRREPYWRSMSEGMAIGYRKGSKSGTWIARHYSPQTRLRYHALGGADDTMDADGLNVFSFAQAQEQARTWFANLARHDRGEAVQRGPFTVKTCVNEYLTWLDGHRKSGADARYRANALILPQLGHILCDKLTTAQIQKWLRELASSPALLRTREGEKQNTRPFDKTDHEVVRRRRSTANRTLTILKAALNRAWREGKIPSDEAWRRVQPFEEADAARVRYLSVAESKRFLNACEPAFRRLCQAALATGARYSEVAALRASDFNADSGTVHVRTSKSGKGRHIVLNADGVALFRALVAGKAGNVILFTKTDGSTWAKSHQDRPMEDACERAKIVPEATFHTLRHTWASHATMNGVPLMVVAKNLGHSDTRMVEKHYGHLAPSYVADAIRAGAPTFDFEVDAGVVSLDDRRAGG